MATGGALATHCRSWRSGSATREQLGATAWEVPTHQQHPRLCLSPCPPHHAHAGGAGSRRVLPARPPHLAPVDHGAVHPILGVLRVPVVVKLHKRDAADAAAVEVLPGGTGQ